jgi:hypothetical protein
MDIPGEGGTRVAFVFDLEYAPGFLGGLSDQARDQSDGDRRQANDEAPDGGHKAQGAPQGLRKLARGAALFPQPDR